MADPDVIYTEGPNQSWRVRRQAGNVDVGDPEHQSVTDAFIQNGYPPDIARQMATSYWAGIANGDHESQAVASAIAVGDARMEQWNADAPEGQKYVKRGEGVWGRESEEDARGSQPEPGQAPRQHVPLWGEGTDILGSARGVGASARRAAGQPDQWGRRADSPHYGIPPDEVARSYRRPIKPIDHSGTADGQARADRLRDQAAQNAADFSNYLLGDPSYTSAGMYNYGDTPPYYNDIYRSGRFVGPEEAAAFAQAMEVELGYGGAADIRQSQYDVVNQKAQQALAQMSGNLSARGIQGGIAGQQAVGYARDAMIPAYAMIEQDYAQNLQRDYERALSLAMNYQQSKTGYNVGESQNQYRWNYLEPLNRADALRLGEQAFAANIDAANRTADAQNKAMWLGFGGNILGAAGSVAGGRV